MKKIERKEAIRYFESLDNLNSFHEQFNYQDNDRAIVIVGIAFIEDLLLYCLESFFPEYENNKSTVYRMLNHSGVLGTYSSKVNMLYCLGFIDKMIKTDLILLGEIRNLFAHKTTITFEDENIIKKCKSFKWHEELMMMPAPKEASAMEIFKVEVNTIVSHLNGLPSFIRGEKRKLKK
ncbi:MltR family transcriptional regulator [Gelidibacter japonicus]|uniref:MltR family transcriptional regulator n=1 Tax=Gelidibacter japonicus TaxID=1962232 RepID=UPI003A923BA5